MDDDSTPWMSDDALARRAREGDSDAVVALYRRYVGEVYGYALHQVGSSEDAEDVTSETFLRMVRALGDFGGRSTFRTWLYAIARNCVRDTWRRQVRAATDDVDVERLAAPPAGDPPVARPEVTALGAAVMAQLPDNYRRVLTLRVIDGRSVRDTAEEMSTSESNVKVMQHRALQRALVVARKLEGDLEDAHGLKPDR